MPAVIITPWFFAPQQTLITAPAVTVNHHGFSISLSSPCIGDFQVSCKGRIYRHLWLLVPATIQAKNQRSDVCVRDHFTPDRSENSTGFTLVKVVKVLGEGGFSFVYLAQDEASGVSRSFACLTL
jgi:hypothetical protein